MGFHELVGNAAGTANAIYFFALKAPQEQPGVKHCRASRNPRIESKHLRSSGRSDGTISILLI
jgi:hypothetical protein